MTTDTNETIKPIVVALGATLARKIEERVYNDVIRYAPSALDGHQQRITEMARQVALDALEWAAQAQARETS